ncbi:MAG: glycogen synthase, partial [Bacteroidetes bacterium]
AYKDSPIFADAKVILSLYNDDFKEKLRNGYEKKMLMTGLENDDFGHYSEGTFVSLMKGAIDRSDALIAGSPDINPEIMEYAKASGKPMLDYQGDEDYYGAYNEFYDTIIGED